MRRLSIIFLLAVLAVTAGCKRFAVANENAPFEFSCLASDGDVDEGTNLTFVILNGTYEGDCTVSLSLKDKSSGASVSDYRVLANGRTIIGTGDTWSFDEGGKAFFTIVGLPKGSYHGVASVLRWYHTASCEFDFYVN